MGGMKLFMCALTVLMLVLASAMFLMAELVGRGLGQSPVSVTRYFVAGVVFAVMAIGALRAAVDNQ